MVCFSYSTANDSRERGDESERRGGRSSAWSGIGDQERSGCCFKWLAMNFLTKFSPEAFSVRAAGFGGPTPRPPLIKQLPRAAIVRASKRNRILVGSRCLACGHQCVCKAWGARFLARAINAISGLPIGSHATLGKSVACDPPSVLERLKRTQWIAPIDPVMQRKPAKKRGH